MKRAKLIALSLFFAASVSAQDIHFSMIDLDPMLFNPAYSGFFDGLGRFGLVYRNQWASVSTPFQTFSATAEWSISRSSRNRNGLSAGLWLSNDRAGTLDYGATSASAIISYYQAFGDRGNDIVSVGAELGVGQIGFNAENIILDDATEDFERNRAFYPTLGLGAAWFHQHSDVLYTKVGASVRNINQPNISYLGMADTRLSRRYNIYGRAEWRFLSSVSLMPLLGFQHQKNFNELVYGTDVRWYIHEYDPDFLAFTAGLMGRHGDALEVNLGVMWQTWTFAFAYDANLSRLASASHTLGAFEMGVTYLIPKKQRRTKALPCPIF